MLTLYDVIFHPGVGGGGTCNRELGHAHSVATLQEHLITFLRFIMPDGLVEAEDIATL